MNPKDGPGLVDVAVTILSPAIFMVLNLIFMIGSLVMAIGRLGNEQN